MQEKNFTIEFGGTKYNAWYVTEIHTALQILSELNTKDCIFGIDTETYPCEKYRTYPYAGLSPHLSNIRLLQIFDGKNSIVFDLMKLGASSFFLPFLSTKRFIGHNSIFDLQYFLKLGVEEMNLGCTRILYKLISHAYYPVETGLDAKLSSLVKSVLKEDISKVLQVSNWTEPDLTFEQVEYAALDAILVIKLAEKLAPGLQKYGLKRIYDLSKAAQLPLAKMQMNGMKLDIETHKGLIDKWREEVHIAQKEATKLMGIDDITSHKVAAWLTENLPATVLKVWPRTPGGKLSTDANTFADFSDLAIIEPLLRFQKASTLCSTFGQGLIDKVNPETKRLHSSYNIAGARTGRLSSSTPNQQNFPRAPEFRSIFIAESNKSLISGDYSQIEVRVAAELSDDRAMKKVYESYGDIYVATAARLNRKPLESVTKHERQVAKALALGLLFGLGSTKFGHYAKKGYGVTLTQNQSEQAVEDFRELYPRYREWQIEQTEAAKLSLTVTTPCGKRRRLPEDDYYGSSLNQPVQGGAAEIMLHALVRLEKLSRKGTFRLLNTVHDEVIVETEKGQEESVCKEVSNEMTKAYLDVFPNGITNKLVGIGFGNNWAEAK